MQLERIAVNNRLFILPWCVCQFTPRRNIEVLWLRHKSILGSLRSKSPASGR
ncbi:hypothetical protein KSP40_PGU021130 [Platanthera guangdongensis]|uniref:Uncharacterized protein n=1 Tax=Platanthera guangdongensis TaxID=2320717 RepID=A0ABR2LE25_9ASPA